MIMIMTIMIKTIKIMIMMIRKYDHESPKVLSTRPHTQKLQYYGAAKTPYSSKLDTLPTGQVSDDDEMIFYHLLMMMIASLFMPGSSPTEGFC